MDDKNITNPVAKAVATVGAATGAQVVESVSNATSIFSDLFVLNWANIASALAAIYVLSQLFEFWWRKFWRPIFERRGWIKVKDRKVFTAREWAEKVMAENDSDNAPLV